MCDTEVSAKQICHAAGNGCACTGVSNSPNPLETKGVNTSSLPYIRKRTARVRTSDLTPHLLAFWVFRLQFVLGAGWIDCYHPRVTCLPHLERRKTIFHPQTWLLSSCYRYYSNQDGFEIRLWTPGSLNAVLIPKAEAMRAPFLVERENTCCTKISPSSLGHLSWWRPFQSNIRILSMTYWII